MSVTPLTPTEAEAGEEPRSRKRPFIVVAVLIVASAAAWWFLLKPAGAEPAPEPGDVTTMEPIQVNLAGGHYLKLGIAVQGVADAAHEVDGSIALDSAIDLFSGRPMEELTQPVQRQKLKADLLERLKERYHGDVMDVYFTDFVTQ